MEFTDKQTRTLLKGKYKCYAHFYKMENIIFRSRLDIISSSINFNQNSSIVKPDALFVMANPGSAEPIGNIINAVIPSNGNIGICKKVFCSVDDSKDQTIWRIKELMHAKNWCRVSIINLSDLQAGKDEDYKERLDEFHKSLSNIYLNDIHSIFSRYRRDELVELIDSIGTAHVVFAWGLNNTPKKEFARFCKEFFDKAKCSYIGVKKVNSKVGYNHPLADEWVSNIQGVLLQLSLQANK